MDGRRRAAIQFPKARRRRTSRLLFEEVRYLRRQYFEYTRALRADSLTTRRYFHLVVRHPVNPYCACREDLHRLRYNQTGDTVMDGDKRPEPAKQAVARCARSARGPHIKADFWIEQHRLCTRCFHTIIRAHPVSDETIETTLAGQSKNMKRGQSKRLTRLK